MASVLSSVLEEVIKSFAGNAFKKQTILNALKNRGVKDIELEQSGMKKFIEEYKGEKIPVAELEAVTAKRADKLEALPKDVYNVQGVFPHTMYRQIRENNFKQPFDVPFSTLNTAHAHKREVLNALKKLSDPMYTMQEGEETKLKQALLDTSNSPSRLPSGAIDEAIAQYKKADKFDIANQDSRNYTAQVLTKNMEHGVGNHFEVPDYYSHVRYTDVPNDARYIHEIQSDVHTGDRYAVAQPGSQAAIDEYNGMIADAGNKLHSSFMPKDAANNVDHAHSFYDLVEHVMQEGGDTDSSKDEIVRLLTIEHGAPPSDKQIVEFSKALEFETMQIHGWNEGIIENTGTSKSKFTKQEPNWLNSTINKTLVDAANEGQKVVKVKITPDKSLGRSEGAQKWYEDTVAPTLQKTAKKIGAEAKMTDDGYMEVKLPEKDFSLPLYSATGIGVLSATTATKAQAAELPGKIKEARDAGYSDEEIQAFTKNKYDPNVLQRSFNLTQGAQ